MAVISTSSTTGAGINDLSVIFNQYKAIRKLIVSSGYIAKSQIKTILSITNQDLESKWEKYNKQLSTHSVQYMLHSSKYECDLGHRNTRKAS